MGKTFLFLIIILINSNIFSQEIIIKLNEGFESYTFPPQGWRRLNISGTNQWQRLAAPLPPEIMQPPVQGTAVARINFEYYGGEDWLITKKINSISTGDSLFFFLIKQSNQGPFPPDSLLIKVSTTDSLQGSFTNTLININVAAIPTGNQVWHKYSFSLSQFAGQNIYIGFQHKDLNGHGIAIDSVVVYNSNYIGIPKNSNIVPDCNKIFQNYPNPFNPSTVIRFQIKSAGFVTLKIFDILGKEITTLLNERLFPGLYEIPFSINGFSGYNFSSGIYLYQLSINNSENGKKDFFAVKSMILIK